MLNVYLSFPEGRVLCHSVPETIDATGIDQEWHRFQVPVHVEYGDDHAARNKYGTFKESQKAFLANRAWLSSPKKETDAHREWRKRSEEQWKAQIQDGKPRHD